MSAGVGYALLSLISAGVLDVVFGRYSRARQVSGVYLVATGLVILIGQTLALAVAGTTPTWNGQAAFWGIVAGVIALLANALLLESLARIPVSLGSTVYRLNTIALVIFAVVLLGESMTTTKLGGIVLGVCAVILLYQRTGHAGDDRIVLVGIWIAVAASLLRATFGIASKIGLATGGDPLLFMLYIGAGWTLAGIGYGLLRPHPQSTKSILAYAIVSGALICLVASFLMLGLRTGEASVVIPIANMSFVVALLVAAALGMEKITPRKLSAVATAALAITLLTRA